jgi:hypothetical protein
MSPEIKRPDMGYRAEIRIFYGDYIYGQRTIELTAWDRKLPRPPRTITFPLLKSLIRELEQLSAHHHNQNIRVWIMDALPDHHRIILFDDPEHPYNTHKAMEILLIRMAMVYHDAPCEYPNRTDWDFLRETRPYNYFGSLAPTRINLH